MLLSALRRGRCFLKAWPVSRSRPSYTPYSDLPPENFWRTAVTEPGPFGMQNLVQAKFKISPTDQIVTLGSCFSQRLSEALRDREFSYMDAEPAPPMMAPETAKRFSYGIFSVRTGNIYTAAMLRQWISWAFSDAPPPEIWHEDGRVQDACRPEIEPGGFATEEELTESWTRTMTAIVKAFTQADVFVFTMGLTEAWQNTDTGLVYPACPGTVAGQFDPDHHKMVNFEYESVRADLDWVIGKLREVNPSLRIILTVSPVPLTATAEPNTHAMVANTYTKSLLRTVAGSVSRAHGHVDYFPGYEMVVSPPMRGVFYAPNMRSVDMFGVRYVMDMFVKNYAIQEMPHALPDTTPDGDAEDADLVCADMILEYYNER